MFTVVTDSTAYLTRRQAEALGVQVLPMSYNVAGMALSEGHLDESGRFRELIGKNTRDLHTSQVPMSAFLSAFNELLRKDGDILCITISSRLSGTFANALIAAREMRTERIAVVDSLSTAAGMRFLVEYAAGLSAAGVSLQDAVAQVERMRGGVGIALSVDDMEALRRSGRLGFVRQSVGTVLNIRPILLCKGGTVVSGGVTRGISGQIRELIRSIPPDATRIEISYVNRRPVIDALQEAARSAFRCPITESGIGPVLAIHLGLSAIGVIWSREPAN